MQHIRVIAAHRATSPGFLKVHRGDVLTVGRRDVEWPGWVWCSDASGRGSWVPESYVDVKGGSGTMNRDYDATELDVSVGDLLSAEAEESGWLWCVNAAGKHGWIPANHAETVTV